VIPAFCDPKEQLFVKGQVMVFLQDSRPCTDDVYCLVFHNNPNIFAKSLALFIPNLIAADHYLNALWI
jgi:hypothetical protein